MLHNRADNCDNVFIKQNKKQCSCEQKISGSLHVTEYYRYRNIDIVSIILHNHRERLPLKSSNN